MGKTKVTKNEIEIFIKRNIRKHPRDIVRLTQEHFTITKPTVIKFINQLIEEKQISVTGKTKDREYTPLPINSKPQVYEIAPSLDESKMWKDFSTLFTELPDNIYKICQYGFTEIANNALEHSEGQYISIQVDRFFDQIEIFIGDDGIGIFKKICQKYNLDDPTQSILELAKGKLTTDPKHHTGEGIFFTSRAFDSFFIRSHNIVFLHTDSGFDFQDQVDNVVEGTTVSMEISLGSKKSIQKIFDEYANQENGYGFDKTIVPVHLALLGNDQLISRSQARRVLSRFDRFKRVVLDFKGVQFVGQSFADEIFRVYPTEHPEVSIFYIEANKQVEKMILRAKGNI